MGEGFTVREYPEGPSVIEWEPSPVLDQILVGGCLPFIVPLSNLPRQFKGVGTMPEFLHHLRKHPDFIEGCWYHLHPDIPPPKTEFRSVTNSLGPGSLQIVINTATGAFEADVDKYNTQDVVNIGGHLGGEVLWPKLKAFFGGLFKRRA